MRFAVTMIVSRSVWDSDQDIITDSLAFQIGIKAFEAGIITDPSTTSIHENDLPFYHETVVVSMSREFRWSLLKLQDRAGVPK